MIPRSIAKLASWQYTLVVTLLLILLQLHATHLLAQSSGDLIDPRSFGLDLPPGKVSPGNGECVTTTDVRGEPVIGRVYVSVGANKIVMMPDGQLAARKAADAPATDRPFAAATKERLAESLAAGEFKGFKVKTTKNYIYLYTSSDEFAFGTGRILESMLPGVTKYAQSQKIETHEPEVPLVVIMFRTEDDFQRYQRMPDGIVAYYHTLTNRVVMFEQSDAFGSRPDIAVQQAISTIAHEGTHQILHNIGVQQRLSLWPMWLSEGVAEYLAPTTFSKKMTWKGAGQVNDMRMFELEQYMKSKAAEEPSGDTVKHTVLAARLTSTGYATAWSLTHYLATKRRVDFNKYMAEMAKLGPFEGSVKVEAPGVVKDNLPPFEKHFGSDFVDIEKKLVQHLVKLPYNDPFANMPHFVAMLTYGEGKKTRREAGTFHSPALAKKWIDEVAAKASTRPAASLKQFPNRPAAEGYARVWVKSKD